MELRHATALPPGQTSPSPVQSQWWAQEKEADSSTPTVSEPQPPVVPALSSADVVQSVVTYLRDGPDLPFIMCPSGLALAIASTSGPCRLAAQQRLWVETGVRVTIPHGKVGIIVAACNLDPRLLCVEPGFIAAGVHNIRVLIRNPGPQPICVTAGNAVARLLVAKIETSAVFINQNWAGT